MNERVRPLARAMIGELDNASPVPLYHQIYLRYRQLILTGKLSTGDRLPSESALEQSVGVSRITAKRAMDELAKDGLVERKRGRGTVVIKSGIPNCVMADISGLVNSLVAIDASTDVELMSFDWVPAPASIAGDMELAEGAIVQRVERRRLRDGKPFSFIVTHVPEDIGQSYAPEDLEQRPILALIEAAGNKIDHASQIVAALDAPPSIADILHVPENSALLNVKRIVRNAEGRVVQQIEVFYRPDAYQLHMTLKRVAHDGEREIWAARSEAATPD